MTCSEYLRGKLLDIANGSQYTPTMRLCRVNIGTHG